MAEELKRENQNRPVSHEDPEQNLRQPRAAEALPGFFKADPEYKQLLIAYQNAEWETSKQLISRLLERYPNDPELIAFDGDIKLQLSLHHQEIVETRDEKKAFVWSSVRNILIALATVLIIIYGAVWFSQTLQRPQQDLSAQMEAVASMEAQAQALLKVGKAAPALELIGQIRLAVPDYAGLDALTQQAEKVVRLESLYTKAMQVTESDPESALAFLKQVAAEDPYFKDVSFQIAHIERNQLTDALLAKGQKAYNEKRWADVMGAYEQVRQMNPDNEFPELEDQLFTSYYQSINDILNSEQTSIEKIDQAEVYYKKAISLIPKNKVFSEDRRQLQKLLVDLLIYKYRQTAHNLIQEQPYSETGMSSAVSYLRKASGMDPQNNDITSELNKAQTYLLGLQKFNQLDWDSAIENLNKLSYFDKTYANGAVQQLLFESYSARGKRYYSVSFYKNAQADFEAAEIIAWERSDNLMQLFQSQLNTGYTLGKTQNFKESSEYLDYAMQTVRGYENTSDLELQNGLINARTAFERKQYYAAYSLYVDALARVDGLYTLTRVPVKAGQNLAEVARLNQSTIQAIMDHNDLPPNTYTVAGDQELAVPTVR